jgi:hypothetical protein
LRSVKITRWVDYVLELEEKLKNLPGVSQNRPTPVKSDGHFMQLSRRSGRSVFSSGRRGFSGGRSRGRSIRRHNFLQSRQSFSNRRLGGRQSMLTSRRGFQRRVFINREAIRTRRLIREDRQSVFRREGRGSLVR